MFLTNEDHIIKIEILNVMVQYRRDGERMGVVIYYLYHQCLSPLTLRFRILIRRGVFNTTLCDKVCQWFAAGRRFSPDTPVSPTNKTERKWR